MEPTNNLKKPQTIQTASLSQRVTLKDVQDFKQRRYDKKDEGYTRAGDKIIFLGLSCLTLLGSILWSLHINRGLAVGLWLIVLFLGCFVLYILSRLKDSVRFERFALANSFTYTDSFKPKEKSNIFGKKQSITGAQQVSGTYAGYPFWLGSYSYAAHAGDPAREDIVTVGVLCITLPRSVPHVILDGRQNKIDTAEGVLRSQKFQLEGDFNEYFDVYCATDYGRDVLYFLTPELMAKLIDLGRAFDVEIIDNKMYFYRPGALRPDEALIWRMFTLIDTVAHNTAKNTARYQDYRINAKTASVAKQGLQLKKSLWSKITRKSLRY